MILAPYDSEWPAEFAALRRVYINSLGKLILRVEHVGSTAVPNLRAKPILDIDIVMPSYDVFPDVVAHLQRLGYTHNGDQVERTCIARASGDRNSFAKQVLDPHVQIVRSEEAWFALHVLRLESWNDQLPAVGIAELGVLVRFAAGPARQSVIAPL